MGGVMELKKHRKKPSLYIMAYEELLGDIKELDLDTERILYHYLVVFEFQSMRKKSLFYRTFMN